MIDLDEDLIINSDIELAKNQFDLLELNKQSDVLLLFFLTMLLCEDNEAVPVFRFLQKDLAK